ncbi:MAG: branched-chain amino acid ABC transporter substrate-binding protein [Desulfobulbaceae bacterium BRH_c16a]|nr:MAG: branched-chain amino acid ABC transporter substrate-binding protein [Desulfobulbaceae bacterium BRH_c16a]
MLLLLISFGLPCSVFAGQKVTIGFNLPLSGAREATGVSTREGAELLRDQINAAGGLQVGGSRYELEFVYADNESNPQKAVAATLDLITRSNVIGIVGPNASSNAIPAGGICESFKTPMISPTSTNPRTTQDRPYVFRACFLDPFQGEVMASFAIKEFKAAKAAVLYDISSAYPKGLAEFFKAAFEAKQGPGSVVAFENFLSSEKDLTLHLDRIVASDADVLFLPQYAHEIPSIVEQARARGWNKIILGGDAWESSDLMANCGDKCKGLYFSSHFGAVGAKGKTQIFVEQYQAKYNQLPIGYAALGYDATSLLLTAIGRMDGIGPNLLENRAAIKDRLAAIKGFEGVSGTLDMDAGGDPAKSAVIIKINDNGEFESYAIENP